MQHLKQLFFILFLFAGPAAFAQLTAKLDSLVRLQASNQPGFALSIEKNGEIVYRREAGSADGLQPLNEYSNFRMASLSKQFTAMGILLLEKDQFLSLDDPISRYLPEMPPGVGTQIRIRHLLTHSSGIADYESLIPPGRSSQLMDSDVLQLVKTQDTTYFPPGSKFRYSNSGFCLLALIIERISHSSFPDFIKQKIFIPLHMDSSAVYEPGRRIPHRATGYAKDRLGKIIPSDQSITSATKGDGGVYTSLADYSKWIRALQQDRFLQLSKLMRRLRSHIEGAPNTYYAAGWFDITGQPEILFHSGSTCGFANFSIQLPGDTWSIVYFSNLADNDAPFRSVIQILKEERVADLQQVIVLQDLTR